MDNKDFAVMWRSPNGERHCDDVFSTRKEAEFRVRELQDLGSADVWIDNLGLIDQLSEKLNQEEGGFGDEADQDRKFSEYLEHRAEAYSRDYPEEW